MKILILSFLLSIFNFQLSTFNSQEDQEALREWSPAAIVSDEAVKAYSLDSCFKAYPISDAIFQRMKGKSYKDNCTVPRTTLRYLRVLHRNLEGKTQLGEIVCNQAIANDLIDIFRKLYEANYKIERIVLIDEYDADDERSMSHNNTSSFNFRVVSGTTKLSKHAQGLAIDINPLYNPYVKRRKDGSLFVQPATAARYADRSRRWPYQLRKGDLCYRLFIKHGFKWGGAWSSHKDYQHFER